MSSALNDSIHLLNELKFGNRAVHCTQSFSDKKFSFTIETNSERKLFLEGHFLSETLFMLITLDGVAPNNQHSR